MVRDGDRALMEEQRGYAIDRQGKASDFVLEVASPTNYRESGLYGQACRLRALWRGGVLAVSIRVAESTTMWRWRETGWWMAAMSR